MAVFPEMPPELRKTLGNAFWTWWQAWKSFVLSGFTTRADITIDAAGKGLVVTNSAGTITKRIKLNDAGTDITIESV